MFTLQPSAVDHKKTTRLITKRLSTEPLQDEFELREAASAYQPEQRWSKFAQQVTI